MVALYLLPLVFVLIEFEKLFSLGVTLFCLVLLNIELNLRLATGKYAYIHINKKGIWCFTDCDGENKGIGFKNSMKIGSAVFLLLRLEGRNQRVLILERQQKAAQFHRLKVYLQILN